MKTYKKLQLENRLDSALCAIELLNKCKYKRLSLSDEKEYKITRKRGYNIKNLDEYIDRLDELVYNLEEQIENLS